MQKNKKDRFIKQCMVLFLMVFILIKTSPNYFLYQYLPQPLAGYTNQVKISVHKDTHEFLIKIDKAIVYRISVLSIPKIKFTGIFFIAFFGALLVVINKYRGSSLNHCLISPDKIFIVQNNLRL